MQYEVDAVLQRHFICLHFSSSDFPCVFGLLPDRKKATYQQFFQELKALATSMSRLWKPERIISDFEASLIPAVASEVKRAVKACNEHSQCFVLVS